MQEMTPENRPEARRGLRDADPVELNGIDGGMMNLNQFGVHRAPPLLSPDGEPISVYVDGVRVSRY